MITTYNSGNWKNLHEATSLTPERTAPCPVIGDYLSRGIPLLTNTPTHETIGLDIGFGLGRNTMFLLEQNYCRHFVGVDQTEVALQKGRSHAELRGLRDRCDFFLSIAGSPFPFQDDSFDFAMDVMAPLTFISNPESRRTYGREICRVLRPGGIFFVFTGRFGGEVYDKLDMCAENEPGTFRRSMDGTAENVYKETEIRNLFPSLDPVILEPQSRYIRAFGEQELLRPGGFWFGVFRKPQRSLVSE